MLSGNLGRDLIQNFAMTYRLDYRRYVLPLRAALRTAHGVWSERDGVLVRLENENGAIGYGEAATIPWFGTETAEDVVAACRMLGEKVNDAQLGALPERCACLRNALASAQAELRGRGEPARILKDSFLGVAALLPAGRRAVTEIAEKSAAGFRVFKWKVGVADLADELALFDDVCAELPQGAKLRLDANGAWDRRAAERWLERCADRPVEHVEQPCFATASEGPARRERVEDMLRGLAGDYPTPIALDESIVGDGDIERWLDSAWPGIFVVKPSLLGNAEAALAKLAAAKATVVFSSALETAVGAKAALRLAFRWTGERRALGFGVWPLFADSQFDGPQAAPFLRWEDVAQINEEAVWKALS